LKGKKTCQSTGTQSCTQVGLTKKGIDRIRETYDLRLTGTAVSPLGGKAGEMLVAISSHIKGKTKQYKAKKPKRTTDGDKSSSRPTKEGNNPSFELDALQIK